MYSKGGIQEFVAEVCEQIRWEKAHLVVSKELKNHIEDQREEYLKQGMNPAEAIKKAVKEMGNPIDIGMELNQVHRPRSQWKLILFVTLLVISSMAMRMLFARAQGSGYMYHKDFTWTIVGTFLMIATYFIDFSILARQAKKLYVGFSLLVLLIGILSIKVSSLYIHELGFAISFDILPITLFFPLIFSIMVYSQKGKGYNGLFTSVGLIVPFLVLMYRYNAAGFLLLFMSGFGILVYATQREWFRISKKKSLLILVSGTVAIAIVLLLSSIKSSPWKWENLDVMLLNPKSYSGVNGLGVIPTREALLGAKFMGAGSMGIYVEQLPEAMTHTFLVVLIHELGWISFIVVAFLMTLLLVSIVRLSQRYSSKLGSFIALSIALNFGIQAALYILFNLGIRLFDPLTFPLLSYEKSLQLTNFILLGILLSTFRYSGVIEDILPGKVTRELFRWGNGELTIRFKS